MAQTAVHVQGKAELMDVVSFLDGDLHKEAFIVDDVFPTLDHNGNRSYLLVSLTTGRQKRADLISPRWVFGS